MDEATNKQMRAIAWRSVPAGFMVLPAEIYWELHQKIGELEIENEQLRDARDHFERSYRVLELAEAERR